MSFERAKRATGQRANGLFFMLCVLSVAAPAVASAAAPSIFFTDLTSGPNAGGESVSGFSGAYVTIYGNNFGATQGGSTVTLGGQNCLRVVSWGTPWLWYQKIVVQLGSACSTGDFSVTVGGLTSTKEGIAIKGTTIDPALFTVRSTGKIYCVATGGKDANPGTFSGGCWQTIPNAVHTMKPGDITYVENGVFASSEDSGYNAAVSILSAGTAANPISLVAYPGASCGVNTSLDYGIRTPAVSGPGPYWTIAGFQVTTTGTEALSFHMGFRVVANTLSCPNGTGTSACVELESDGTIGQSVYGNVWNQAGSFGSDKTYHALYFSATDDHSDIGWNDIHNVRACRAIQFYNEGVDMTDLHVHDNLIHDISCDAININGANPNAGPIEVFNNVMYNVGLGQLNGQDPPDGAAIYSCVNLEMNGSYTTPAQIYNNTCFNAGDPHTSNPSQSGGFSLYVPAVLRNNVVYQNNGQPYLTSDAGCKEIQSGSTNNDWFGNGGAPACSGLSGSKNLDPKFSSLTTPDFHLQSGSPMIDAGVTISSLKMDHDGIGRPQGAAYDIGAYEFNQGSTPPPPPPPTTSACDLNSDSSVNVADVQVCVNQVLGVVPCTNADLQGNGTCTAIDVQRVVNSALGQTCVVGP